MDTYLVGGAVRDELLGRRVRERDWVVVGSTPRQMLARGFRQVGRDFPVFLHPESHEQYALARTERKTGPGHTGFVCHSGPEVSLAQDLKRRDLTINAMARSADGALVDPYGGARDLAARCLRHVSPAFCEDPLRVFRVARFAASFEGFRVAPETMTLMQRMARDDRLRELPAERVWQEIHKALGSDAPQRFFQVLGQAHALRPWLSELAEIRFQPPLPLTAALERFAAMGWLLSRGEMEALCRRLRVPRRHQRLAQLVALHGRRIANWRHEPAEEVLTALTAAGVFGDDRDVEHAMRVVEACARTHLRDLRALLPELCAVSAADFHRCSLHGPALGAAIREGRCELLRRASEPGHRPLTR